MIVRTATLRKAACIAAGTAALLLAGCAKSGDRPRSAALEAGAQSPSAALTRNASVGKARAPVLVTFDRRQGLEPGQPEEIKVTFLPQAGLDNLTAEFRGSEGLNIVDGAHYLHPGAAQAATPVSHPITVSASAPGSYRVSVVISTSVGGTRIARALAIPIAVGDAAAARVQVQSTAKTDSKGQLIKVLPAERRTR